MSRDTRGRRRGHRLYLQIYVTLLGVLLLFGVLVGFAWHLLPEAGNDQRLARAVARLVTPHLPPAGRPAAEQQAALARLAAELPADLSLAAADGTPLASSGGPLPAPDPGRAESHWLRGSRRGWSVALRLDDGRWLVARHRPPAGHVVGFWLALALLALAVAIGAWPLVRRLTRRLERLQARVEALGRGDLGARVAVEGEDEVADLARSFNHAADRIEALVTAQRRLLAGASHELRSPLARIRVAAELVPGAAALKRDIARDVAELDALIEELLDASRLQAPEGLARSAEELDLLGLVAEEAARVGGAAAGGTPVSVRGDARLLRRLVRNLLDNARRHGRPPIEASVVPRAGGGVVLVVADHGPGVAEAERERIFEPFYRPPEAAESGGGAGLGLALVREIARAHGGDVRCVVPAEGGSRFEVELAGLATAGARPRAGAARASIRCISS